MAAAIATLEPLLELGNAAQALVERWFELSRRAYIGDPEVQTDSPTA